MSATSPRHRRCGRGLNGGRTSRGARDDDPGAWAACRTCCIIRGEAMDKHISATQAPGASALDPINVREARVRRANNKLRHIHHHAYRCRDAEETRHFYEDILNMPLVAAVVMQDNPVTQGPDPYCHLFFEMGDGNCIAFFDCPAVFKKSTFKPETGLDHHVALEVEGDEVIAEYRQRLQEAGVQHMFLDH